MMKLITIVASAALVSAGTNKTLAPTPGISRPGTPAPITPFPTEPPQVRLYIILLMLCFIIAMMEWPQRQWAAIYGRCTTSHHMSWCMCILQRPQLEMVHDGACIYQLQ